MEHKGEPFYFSSQGQSIFGLYEAPRGLSRGEGIVICNPMPQEMMRSYQSLVLLGKKLSELGFAVLRFDYYGTGDSDGDSSTIRLSKWESNIISAVTHLKKLSGLSKISLCGVRLGASLALRVSQSIGIKQLVLWDPIANGSEYCKTLESSHRLMLERNPIEPPYHTLSYSKEQCWGFPWTAGFQEDLQAIEPGTFKSLCKKIQIIESTSRDEWNKITESFEADGISISRKCLQLPLYWDDDRHMKIRAFPAKHIQMICESWEGV